MRPGAKGVWGILFAALTCVAALSQTSPEFLRLTTSNSEATIEFTAPANQRLRLDAAEEPGDWQPLLTLRATAGTMRHLDSASPQFIQRFYRAEMLEDASAFLGDHLVTTNGVLTIQPIHHASFAMKWNDLIIYNDPASPANFTGLPKADLILVSHSHGDHFDTNAINTLSTTNTVIVAPQAVYNSMNATLRARTTILRNGDSTNLLGLGIEAIPAYNANHAVGAGNGYVVTIGGKRIYMAGDTGDIPEMRALAGIDAAFLPMNVPFTMNIINAASAVREFKPRIVYPYHFRNSGGTYADTNAFKRMVGQDLGIEVRLRKWY